MLKRNACRDNRKALIRLLKKDRAFHRYCMDKGNDLRDTELENVIKVMACGTCITGYKRYSCPNVFNSECDNTGGLITSLTCNGKFCPRCGMKRTEQWIATQNAILPDCDYQHAVLTLPAPINALFNPYANRWLLNHLSRCAAQVFLKLAKKKGIQVGIFTAIHTFGRSLNWHSHMHVSVTAGGLNDKGEWVEVEFEVWEMIEPWKEAIAKLLRKYYHQLEIPKSLLPLFGSYEGLDAYLTQQCKSSVYWHLFIAKKTKGCKRTAGYMGKYIRRPPVSESKLRHYNADGNLIFTYHDHKTGKQVREVVTPYEMVSRLLTHIHEKHFRTLRFYGFLANRVRGEKLPLVYSALNDEPQIPFQVTHASLAKGYTGRDPYLCEGCGGRLVFEELQVGLNLKKLVSQWEAFALDGWVRG